MTPLALAAEAASARPRRLSRLPLAAKLAFGFVGLVALVLIVNGAIDAFLSYTQAKRAALEVQGEKARAAAERVGVFLDEIQTQLGWTAGVEWGYSKLEQQRYDFIRLLRQAPAITALAYIDGKGREQLAVSRLEPDAVGSGKDFSADPRFLRAVADKVWFGPVEFRRGSEPYMTIALAHVGKTPGVTVADVNLKLVWDVVSAIRVGDKGFAYVVDDHGRLIAHPDLSLVLRDTDFSTLPQVAAALKATAAGAAEAATSHEGAAVLTSYAVAPRTHWVVFVEQPLSEALATAYRSLVRSLALLGLGLALAAVSGVALARRMAAPIRTLQAGAEKLGAGDLAQRLDIRTGDEIEALAGGFNRMAERLQESYEDLEGKVEARTLDLTKALERQTATAEILKVIASSTNDTAPVFQAIVASAKRLLGGRLSLLTRFVGDIAQLAAFTTVSQEHDAAFVAAFPRLSDDPVAVALRAGRTALIRDAETEEHWGWREGGRQTGFRSAANVPLVSQGTTIGGLTVNSAEPNAFDADDVELLRTFADQAVIAIENVRLFNETKEALAQQTATADVLKTISRSAFDLQAVLDTLVASAVRLFGAHNGIMYLQRDEAFHVRATANPVEFQPIIEQLRARPHRPGRGSVGARVLLSGEIQHVSDLQLDPEYDPELKAASVGRAVLGVPMKRDGAVVGAIVFVRREAGPYGARQIELAQTFADQAVIAIENARLFDEVQARTREVEHALERQTATSEILRVIAGAPGEADKALQFIAQTSARLFEAASVSIQLAEGGAFVREFRVGAIAQRVGSAYPRSNIRVGGRNLPGTVVAEGRQIHIPDLDNLDPAMADYPGLPHARAGGARTVCGTPLRRDDRAIGALIVFRDVLRPFAADELTLLQTFADQAVIAIENARLINETRESLAQQTATADVLKVISRSAFDLDAIFQTLVATAVDLCGASSGTVCVRDGDVFRYRGMAGPEASPVLQDYLKAHPLVTPGRETVAGRAILSRQTEEIADVLAETDYAVPFAASGSSARALLGVPLIGKTEVLGAIVVARAESGAFPHRHVEILRTFADQAVIAIENARLFDEVQARTRELEQSLSDLRKAQDRLVQSEKLASLGQLTAGIAHEIKNPLNFVNNFATLSRELLEELREPLRRLPEDAKADAQDLMAMIDSNLEKVASHGKRADSIVKNMLLHSREGAGERTRVNINAMVEEALNLGYHGARAEKPGFNVTLEKDFAPDVGEADLYLQEVTRVLLNLISNAFYATAQRKLGEGPDYSPTLKATTRDLGHNVEIRIRDNGAGIPDEVRARMFNPFFTTKPAGEGTGLGLSLSHDIVVKQHGGTIDVETQPGPFTEFVITLPREGAVA